MTLTTMGRLTTRMHAMRAWSVTMPSSRRPSAAPAGGCGGCTASPRVWASMSLFFSSRRRHTRLQGDWSSDVCSSDLEIRAFRHRCPHAGGACAVPGDLQVRAAALPERGGAHRGERRPAVGAFAYRIGTGRSEEHTSELQSPCNLVCRLLLEKKKKTVSLSLDIDEPANLYPLAVVLYALATGDLPSGSPRSASLLRAQLSAPRTPSTPARTDRTSMCTRYIPMVSCGNDDLRGE